jgi:hypothetical protein
LVKFTGYRFFSQLACVIGPLRTEQNTLPTLSVGVFSPHSRRARDTVAACIVGLHAVDEKEEALCNAVDCLDSPNYTAAMKSPQMEQWKVAIESELQSLRDNCSRVV